VTLNQKIEKKYILLEKKMEPGSCPEWIPEVR